MKTTLLTIIGLFSLAIGVSFAAGETQSFQYDTENLNSTSTFDNIQINPDGTVDQFVGLSLHYRFDNKTEADKQPEPIKADPVGTFYQLLLNDFAKIFTPSTPTEETVDEEPVIDETVDEPVRRLTGPEQQALNRLKDQCDYEGGEGKALAFQAVYKIFLDHPIEWYALYEHQDERNVKYEECRGLEQTQLIANLTIGSRIIDESDTFIFTPTDQTQKNNFDFAVGGDMWNERNDDAIKARDSNIWTKGLYNGTDNKPFGFTPTVQRVVDEAKEEFEQHKIETDNSIKNVKSLCSILWKSTGNGTTGLRTWNTNLTNGMCDNFLYISQWEYTEDGFAEKVTKQIDLRGLINAKLEAGDEL